MSTAHSSSQTTPFPEIFEVDSSERDIGTNPGPVQPCEQNPCRPLTPKPPPPPPSVDGHIVRSPVSVRETLALPAIPVTPLSTSNEATQDLPQKSRKRVHYCWAPPTVDVPSSPGPTEEERSLIWYSRRELSEFKRQAKRQCKQAWRDNQRDLDLFYCSSEDKQDEQSPSLPFTELHQASEELARSELFTSYRGLEHLTSQKLCLVRSMTVLAAKTELMLEQMAGSSQTAGNIEDADEKSTQRLADLYRKASLPAARFARVVALADAVIAGYPLMVEGHQRVRAAKGPSSDQVAFQLKEQTHEM